MRRLFGYYKLKLDMDSCFRVKTIHRGRREHLLLIHGLWSGDDHSWEGKLIFTYHEYERLMRKGWVWRKKVL